MVVELVNKVTPILTQQKIHLYDSKSTVTYYTGNIHDIMKLFLITYRMVYGLTVAGISTRRSKRFLH